MPLNLHFQNYALSLLLNRPPPPVRDWDGLVRFVIGEQIQGLVFQLIKDRRDVPDAVKGFLERAYFVTFAANTARIESIRELDRQLASTDINVLILKGASLLETTYEDPGLRPMEDIDLLVLPEDVADLQQILNQCGYQSDPLLTAMFRKDDVLIDVHTSLMHTGRIRSRGALFPIEGRQIFDEAIPWGQGLSRVRRPDEATHVIFMAHHMIKHSFSKLIWMVDFLSVVRDREDRFWEELNRKAIRYRQEKPLLYVFFLMERLLHFLPPDWTVFYPVANRVTAVERYLLNFRIRGRSLGDLGNILWINCLNSRLDRWLLLKETLFPEADVLKREYPETGGLSRPRLLIYRGRRVIRQIRHNLEAMLKGGNG